MTGTLANLQGIIFDLDGTLVDSALDFPAMRRETGCPEGTGLLEYIAGLSSARERQAAEAVIHRYEMAGAKRARWMPGALALLQAVARSPLRAGIVTRNSRPAAELTLSTLGAPPLDLVSREMARPKPDPDGLLLLARRWRLPAARLAYVGDFQFDIKAAARAGMRSVLYLQEKNADYAHEADHVFDHFDQLSALLDLAR